MRVRNADGSFATYLALLDYASLADQWEVFDAMSSPAEFSSAPTNLVSKIVTVASPSPITQKLICNLKHSFRRSKRVDRSGTTEIPATCHYLNGLPQSVSDTVVGALNWRAANSKSNFLCQYPHERGGWHG